MRHLIETNNRMLNDDLTPISGWSSVLSVTMRQRTRTSGLWSSTHSGSLLLYSTVLHCFYTYQPLENIDRNEPPRGEREEILKLKIRLYMILKIESIFVVSVCQ